MDTVTLEEMLESLKENIDNELESEGLASWTISSGGSNFAEEFNHYTLEDLKDLQSELVEGATAILKIDLSEALLDHVSKLVESMEPDQEDYYDEDYEDLDN